MEKIEREKHTIDATDKSLGRLAVSVANLLRGKSKPEYAAHRDLGDFVSIENITQIKFSGKKIDQKVYYHHSGYLGGLKEKPLSVLFKERPDEVLRKAVWGMMPKNRLRSDQIKRLVIK